jgi:hypothetical protein
MYTLLSTLFASCDGLLVTAYIYIYIYIYISQNADLTFGSPEKAHYLSVQGHNPKKRKEQSQVCGLWVELSHFLFLFHMTVVGFYKLFTNS